MLVALTAHVCPVWWFVIRETHGADGEADRTAVTGPHLDARITPGSTTPECVCGGAVVEGHGGRVPPTDVVVGLLPLVAWVAL